MHPCRNALAASARAGAPDPVEAASAPNPYTIAPIAALWRMPAPTVAEN